MGLCQLLVLLALSELCLCVLPVDDPSGIRPTGPKPKLFVADYTKIHEFDLDTKEWEATITDLHQVSSVAYGPDNTLYWTDSADKALYSIHLKGSHHYLKQTIIDTGLESPVGVAVDWLADHLYIVDGGRIVCCKRDGSLCVVVIRGLVNPHAITIYQEKRKLIWSTLGKTANIESSDLNGEQRLKVIERNIEEPVDIFVDHVQERLYWVDARLERLESARLDGTDRRTEVSRTLQHPLGVAIFEDLITWTDAESVYQCKRSEKCVHIHEIGSRFGRPTKIAVGHPEVYNTSAENLCKYNDCSDLCIPGNRDYSCACPVNSIIDSDGKTCTRSHNTTDLYMGGRGSILKLSLSDIGYVDFLVETIPLPDRFQYPGSLTVQPDHHTAVYIHRNAIVRTTINSDHQQTENVLYKDSIHSVTDLTVDWVTGVIYWTDIVKGTIEVGHVLGGLHTTLLDSDDGIQIRPNSLAVDFKKGQVYYSDVGGDVHSEASDSYIGCYSIADERTVELPVKVGRPNKITLDSNRLYISDKENLQIVSVSAPDGLNRKVHWQGSALKPSAIAVVDDWIYFTAESDGRGIYHVSKTNINQEGAILQKYGKITSLMFSNNAMKDNLGCHDNNGGCEHFCLVSSKPVCRCADNFVLQKDNRTCVPKNSLMEKHENSTSLVCAGFQCHGGECVDDSYLCDDVPDCMDGSDEFPAVCHKRNQIPTATLVCPDKFSCDFKCLPYDQVCDGVLDCDDGTDEGDLCDISCSAENNQCQHECLPTPKGSVCACHPGYKLMSDGKTCEDIDECSVNNGNCSQRCKNTKGFRQCLCTHGYTLTNSTVCVHTAGEVPYLLVGGMTGITNVSWTGQRSKDLMMGPGIGEVIAFDVTMKTKDIIFSTKTRRAVFIHKGTTHSNDEAVTIVMSTPGLVYDLAYDWLTGNIYMTCGNNLMVCKGALWCKTLRHDEVIRHVILCPPMRKLFYVRPGRGEIAVMWLDGSEEKTLVKSTGRPVALTVDHTAMRIFWLEAETNKIQSCNMDGSDRHVVFERFHLRYFTSMTVFENNLYLNDFRSGSLYVYNKNGQPMASKVIRLMSRSFIVKVVHPVLQTNGTHSCGHLKCSHLCILGAQGGSCQCPDGFLFQENSTTNCSDVIKPTMENKHQALSHFNTMRNIYEGQSTPATQQENKEGLPGLSESSLPPEGGNDICSRSYCQGQGECYIAKSGNMTCRCDIGYHGLHCDSAMMPHSGKYSLIVGVTLGLFFLVLGLIVCALCCSYERNHWRTCSRFLGYKPCSKQDDAEELVPEPLFHNSSFASDPDNTYQDLDDISYRLCLDENDQKGLLVSSSPLSVDSACVSGGSYSSSSQNSQCSSSSMSSR